MPLLAREPACWPDVPKSAWVRVAREAVGAEGQVASADDRRRLDLVVYGATANGGALCCDATLVSPLTRTGHPHPCTVEVDGAALRVAERRKHCTYPELARGGPQKLLVLGSEIGGRWNTAAQGFVRDLVRLRALRAPPAVRA
ncbi:CPY1, partial [Symbiodinium sp. KB8]